MTRITQTDQIMLLLRQQLQRMAGGSKAARSGRTGAPHAAQRESPLHRVSALAALNGLPDDELGKALVRALLTEEFGDALANEPKFARIVSEVHRMIASDTETKQMLDRSLEQVKRGEGG